MASLRGVGIKYVGTGFCEVRIGARCRPYRSKCAANCFCRRFRGSIVHRMKLPKLTALLLAISTATGLATDFYVNPTLGNNSANGLAAKVDGSNGPVKTIARGLQLAQPGDTVHLAPAVFPEVAVFN